MKVIHPHTLLYMQSIIHARIKVNPCYLQELLMSYLDRRIISLMFHILRLYLLFHAQDVISLHGICTEVTLDYTNPWVV